MRKTEPGYLLLEAIIALMVTAILSSLFFRSNDRSMALSSVLHSRICQVVNAQAERDKNPVEETEFIRCLNP